MENKYKNWRKSIEKDGITKSVNVDECENGFYICISTSGYKKSDCEGYYHEEKKYVSSKNPLEGEEENEKMEKEDDIMEAIEAVLGEF